MNRFLIGYPIFVVAGALGIVAWQFDYTGVDWPAWVQAVGSIAAIVAAIQIARNQHKQGIEREEGQSHRREMQLQSMLFSVLEKAAELIHAMPIEPSDRRDVFTYLRLKSSRSQFEELARILREAPLYDTGDNRIFSIVVDASDCLDRAKRIHEHAATFIGGTELLEKWSTLVPTILGEQDAMNALVYSMSEIVHSNAAEHRKSPY